MGRRKLIAQKLSFLMPHIARALTSSFTQATDLPPAQIFTLLIIQERRSCHFAALCRDLHIAAPTATGIIDRLEKSGYVKRQPDARDRRAINIVLTRNGEKITKEIRLGIGQRWESLLGKISLADGENYLKIVTKIYSQISTLSHDQEQDFRNAAS